VAAFQSGQGPFCQWAGERMAWNRQTNLQMVREVAAGLPVAGARFAVNEDREKRSQP